MEFKEIVKEWQEEFPILSPYTSVTLMARTDIFMIGLRLDRRWSEMYAVILEILPLWVSKEKIIIPVLREDARDKKGLQIDLECKLHDPLLPDYVEAQKMRGAEIDIKKFELQRKVRRRIIDQAMECVHNQFDDVLQENVGLSAICRLINDHTHSGYFPLHNPMYWYRLLELKLALAYHFKREDLILEVKSEIEKVSNRWTQERCNEFFGKSREEWKEDLYQRIGDREAFMKQVEMNLSLKKISRLKAIQIHDDIEPRKTLFQRIGDKIRAQKNE